MRRHLSAACLALAVIAAGAAPGTAKQLRTRGIDTLVLYVFRHLDAESVSNFKFFFDHGPKELDGAHYYVLIQESDHAEVREVRFLSATTLQTSRR